MKPITTVILPGAEVHVDWIPAHAQGLDFFPGFLSVLVGHLGFSMDYDLAHALAIAILRAEPTELSKTLEDSVRQAVERNAQRARPALTLVGPSGVLGEHGKASS